MPKVRRNEPPYLQIANHYRDLIVTGQLTTGARLPALREIADEWEVSVACVQRATGHLKVAGLITASNKGTFVNGATIKLAPRDRLAAVKAGGALLLRTERADVTEAGLVAASGNVDYVADLLGLEPGGDVIRRQQVFYEPDGSPGMLAVSWFPPVLAEDVPELLAAAPVPTAAGEVSLIAERTGRAVTHSEESARARGILDDGRESPLLRLPVGTPCYAGVYLWFDREDVLEYGEYVLPPDKVVSHQHDWA